MTTSSQFGISVFKTTLYTAYIINGKYLILTIISYSTHVALTRKKPVNATDPVISAMMYTRKDAFTTKKHIFNYFLQGFRILGDKIILLDLNAELIHINITSIKTSQVVESATTAILK